METNPLVHFLTAKKLSWLRHLIFILISLTLAFKGDFNAPAGMNPQIRRAILLLDTSTFVAITAILYFMMQVLIPRLLFKSRQLAFCFAFLGLIILVYLVVWFADYYFFMGLMQDNDPRRVGFSFGDALQVGMVAAVVLASVAGLKVFQKWILDTQHMGELQQNNLKTELAQLKSQVNPHFLFNTLNNLNVLVKTDTEKASQVLLGLSDLLRYQLYDSAKEQISLSKDIEFIKNLVALEKIRKDDFSFSLEIEGSTDNIQLPPFLFIPFIENAIKHGASTIGHSWLKVVFQITGSELYFYSENSKPPVRQNLPGGLGLKNIRRRL
ncbi:MAG: histidine kinase, partial [Gemmatimonadaceae bacterium]|nr:histidine kinase [Chitinophagaceae bacterium]